MGAEDLGGHLVPHPQVVGVQAFFGQKEPAGQGTGNEVALYFDLGQ